jgi:hypothetical protein
MSTLSLKRTRGASLLAGGLLLGLAAGGWLSLVSVCVAAEPPKKDGRYKLGPLHVTPRLRLTSGIDTNVFQTLADPTRDAVVVLSPRVDGALPVGRRLRLTGLGYVDVNYFRRQDDERSVDFYGEGRGELYMGAVTFFGGGGGGQFTQRFSIDVDDRLERQEKRAYAGATWHLTRRLSLTGQGSNEILTFAPGVFRLGGSVKEAMDRNTLAATGQIRFALSPRTTLLVSGEAIEDRFFSQPSNLPPERQSYRFLGGVEFGGRSIFTGRVLAGLRDFPGTLEQGSPAYRGPVVAADLSLPVGRFARLRLVGERDVLYASSLVEAGTLRYRNAFVYNRYLGEVVVELPLQCLAFLQAGFERSDYLLPYPYPNDFSLNDRVDNRYTAGASLLRQFGDSVRMGGHVAWARRVSSLPVFSYEGLRYGLTAEVRP